MVQIVFTSSGSFADPGDWNPTNRIECLGSGGGSAIGVLGGGGGAYATASNVNAVFPVAVAIANQTTTQFGGYCSAASGANGAGAGGAGGTTVFPAGYAGGRGDFGGGGAAGPSGAGGNAFGSVGGSANGGATPGGGNYLVNGQNGSEWGLYGCGSGGGEGADAGFYGGAAGMRDTRDTMAAGGLVIITYTPVVPPAGAMAMVIG